MGTFEKIRKISPYFFGLFAVLLIAYFVFTSGGEEVLKQQMGDPKTAKIGEVNGEPILFSRFEKEVRDIAEKQRKKNKSEETDVDEVQIRNQVWSQLVDEILLRQLATEAGVRVTDEELRDLLIENPPEDIRKQFSDSSGKFMKEIYLDMITNPETILKYTVRDQSKLSEMEKAKIVNDFREFLINYSKFLRFQKYQEGLMMIAAASEGIISPEFSRQKFTEENSTVSLKYIAFQTKDIPEAQVKVSGQEIKKYYDEHKKYYKQKPQRRVKYVSFPIAAAKEDTIRAQKIVERIGSELINLATPEMRTAKFDEMVNEFYGDNVNYTLSKDIAPEKMQILTGLQKNQVIGPVQLSTGVYFFRLDDRRQGESAVVKASHILVKSNNNKDSALAEAKKILARAKSGEDFATLAHEFSEDKGSGAQGGDLGFFAKGQMVKEFEEAAFSATPGSIVGPVESQFGYHIIKVVDKNSDELKYSEILVVPKISVTTRNILKRDAISLKKQVEEGASIDTIAKRLNKKAIQTSFLEKTRPILGSMYVTDKSFDAEQGAVLEPLELKNYGIVVIQVTEIREAGVKPLEDMKQIIEKKLIEIKRLDILKQQAEKLYNQLTSSGNIENARQINPSIEIKDATNIKMNAVVPGIGRDAAFSAQAFIAPLNSLTKPVRGEHAYYIMVVTSRSIPAQSKIDQEHASYTENLRKGVGGNIFNQWYTKIKADTDIKDYRSKYYREY